MNRDSNFLNTADPLPDGTDQTGVLVGDGVPDGVGNVDGGGAGIYRGLYYAAEKVDVRTRGVFR